VLLLASSTLGGDRIDGALLRSLVRHGLPDVRGARWVHVEDSRWGPERLPFTSEGAGNAWLLNEEPGGMAVVVYDQTRRVRLKQVPGKPAYVHLPSAMEPTEGLIEPADLDRDLRELEAGLDRLRTKGGAREEKAPAAGEAPPDLTSVFLLLAQLQGQGNTRWVARLLPKIQAQTGSRKLAQDGLSLLASERAYEADLQWVRDGNPTAYAEELEKFAAYLPKSSTAREGTLALAQRLRLQKGPSTKGLSRQAAEAERILLALRPEHLVQLPVGANWLLPHASYANRMLVGMFTWGDPAPKDNAPSWEEQEEFTGSPRPPPETLSFVPIRDFLLRRAPAAAALVELLDDRRLLRVFKQDESIGEYPSKPVSAYGQIQRPFEVREIVWALLCGLASESESDWADDSPAARKRVAAWVKSLAKLNEAQLAVAYYKEKYGPGQAEQAILDHPSPEGLALLRHQYLEHLGPVQDPNDRYDGYSILQNLKKYVEVLGADGEAFTQELMARLRGRPAEPGKDTAEGPPELNESQLRLVERSLRPPSLEKLLAELKTADENTAGRLSHDLAFVLGPTLDEKREAKLLQAAAEASSMPARRLLLSVLNPTLRLDSAADLPRVWYRTSFAMPEARQALGALLRDQTVLFGEPGNPDDPPFTLADQTREGILFSRFEELLQPWWDWRRDDQTAAERWTRAVAEAMIADRPAPPFPKLGRRPENN
jgi:hypothetical protein